MPELTRPPDFCQYAAGPCDQVFTGTPATRGVILYPSQPPQIAATIEGAAANLEERGDGKWITWKEFRTTGEVIFCAICKAIRYSGVVVADVTTLNLNLMFEIGFALGLELPVLLIRDTSYIKDTRDFDELGMLDTIGYIDFKTSAGLADRIAAALPATAIPIPPATLSRETPLYVVKDPIGHEGQVRLLSTVKRSPLRFRTYDPLETPRLSLHEARKQVAASYGVVGHLLAAERRGSIVHNARTALIAGAAVASGKFVTLLQEGHYRQPIDYRDIVSVYETPNQIPGRLDQLIRSVTIALQEDVPHAAKPPHGFLEKLDLGDVAAENEIRQLRGYFVATGQFGQARRGHARLIVGRKGSGKTAIFYAVRDALPKTSAFLVLDMKPEGHQFTKLREAILAGLSAGVQEHTLTAFWHYILLCEIAYRILETDYSWAERDQERHARFEALRAVYNQQVPAGTGDLSERLLNQIEKLTDRFERAGRPTDPRALTQALFIGDIPELERVVTPYLAHKKEVWLLIDNLDKGWPTRGASPTDILILRTLLEATRKLQRRLADNVAFHCLVFLRNDIYEHLVRDTPDKDKDTAINVDWDDPALFKEIVRQRIMNSSDLRGDFGDIWPVVSEQYVGSQDSFGFIVERTLMRPRDLLKFLLRAIEFAVNRGHEQLTQDDLKSAERVFSEDMLISVNFEIGDVYPAFKDLLYHFIGCSTHMSMERAKEIMKDILEQHHDLAVETLMWFGFLGAQSSGADEPQFSYQVQYNITKLTAALRGDRGQLVVHPAFRTALGCVDREGAGVLPLSG